MLAVIVIPARFASTRLPGKPLSKIAGRPMIEWVWRAAQSAKKASKVIVATDDERVMHAVRQFGGEAFMTSPDLQSGTDRVAETAQHYPADIVVNVQGDEPLMSPLAIDAAIELVASGRFKMSTVMTPMRDAADLENRAVVKVIADRDARAIYFSRYAIPYSRIEPPVSGQKFACHRHVGLYAFTKPALEAFRALPVSDLERGESLEQLRALEHGWAIGIQSVDFDSIGVDTPDELKKAEAAILEMIKKGKLNG